VTRALVARALAVRDATVRFGEVTALAGVSVEALPGRILGVSGPSGAGKTTLLHVLAGVERLAAGEVVIDGSVALVPQTYGLAPVLTALESVALPLQVGRRTPRAEVETRARAALESVGLGRYVDHLTNALSGGQQQRVAVARALAADADILIADEPTSELDADNRELVMSLLRERAAGWDIVVVASDDPLVTAKCDDSLALLDGQVVPPELLA
jgi:putative ABC transport system ATP-binding protein